MADYPDFYPFVKLSVWKSFKESDISAHNLPSALGRVSQDRCSGVVPKVEQQEGWHPQGVAVRSDRKLGAPLSLIKQKKGIFLISYLGVKPNYHFHPPCII